MPAHRISRPRRARRRQRLHACRQGQGREGCGSRRRAMREGQPRVKGRQARRYQAAKDERDPQKTAAIEPKKPAPAPAAAKPASPETAKRDDAAPGPDAGAQQQPAEEGESDQQDQAMLGPDGAPIPDGWQDQGPAGQVPARIKTPWAPAVPAPARARRSGRMGACGRRHRGHAVRALHAGASGLCAAGRLAGAGDLRASLAGSRCRTRIAARLVGSSPRRSRRSQAPRARRATRVMAVTISRYGPNDRYADEAYPYGAPPPPWRARRPGSEFGNFFRRALGGF